MRKNRFVIVTLFLLVSISGAAAQGQYPTRGWPTAAPAAAGLDARVLGEIDADVAAGMYGNVDSFLVIRHGKLVYDRSYRHDYDRIYGKEAGERGALNA